MENQNSQTPVVKPVHVKARIPVIYLGLGLVILVLILLSGFLFYKNNQLKKQIVSLKMASPTSIATPDTTTGWKTYTNTKYDYSIKVSTLPVVSSPIPLSNTTHLLDTQLFLPSIFISVWNNDKNLSLQDWLNQNGSEIGNNNSFQPTTFNGYIALVSNRGVSSNWYFISHGNYIYEIQDDEIVGAGTNYQATQEQIDRQKEILSTFIFIGNPLNATTLKQGKGVLTWNQVINAIQNCKLDAIYEHTDNQVEVHSNGYVYITQEPNYGDVLNETKNAELKCGEVYTTSGLQ